MPPRPPPPPPRTETPPPPHRARRPCPAAPTAARTASTVNGSVRSAAVLLQEARHGLLAGAAHARQRDVRLEGAALGLQPGRPRRALVGAVERVERLARPRRRPTARAGSRPPKAPTPADRHRERPGADARPARSTNSSAVRPSMSPAKRSVMCMFSGLDPLRAAERRADAATGAGGSPPGSRWR